MPPVGFEPTISAGERPQIYALDRAATGTGKFTFDYAMSFCVLVYLQFIERKKQVFETGIEWQGS